MRYTKSDNLIKKDDYKVVLLIDYGYIFQICIGNNKIESKEKALKLLLNRLKDLFKKIPDANGEFIIVGESKTNFRKLVNKDYKANRDKPYLKWGKLYKEFLSRNETIYTIPDYEADDTIGVLYTMLSRQYKSGKIDYMPCIVGTDKDYNQIEGCRYSPSGYHRPDTFINVTKEQANYNFWWQMLVGDTVDNIKGIPDVGKATAKWLLNIVDEKNKLLQKRCNFKGVYTYRDEVFQAYIRRYKSVKEGMHYFKMNFDMLKLKTIDDIQDITKLPKLKTKRLQHED